MEITASQQSQAIGLEGMLKHYVYKAEVVWLETHK